MQTNYLAVDTTGRAHRVTEASPAKPEALCNCTPLDGGERVGIAYRDLRPLRTEMDASLALSAARHAKNYDAARSCEQALALMGLERQGFIPSWGIPMTLAEVFAREPEPRSSLCEEECCLPK